MEDIRNKIRKDYTKLTIEEMMKLHSDLTPSNENILVKSMLPMAYQIANKYWYHQDAEDLIAVANTGILNGIRNFNPSNNTNATLITFCKICANNAVLTYMKRSGLIRLPHNYKDWSDEKKESSTTASTLTDSIELYEKYLTEETTTNSKIITTQQLIDILTQYLGKRLKPKQIVIFSRYYTEDINYQELAIEYNISKQRVGQIVDIVLGKIQNNSILKEKLYDLLN